MTSYTAQIDTFARDNLPPVELQPEYIFEMEGLQFSSRLNCAVELLDNKVLEGLGEKTAFLTTTEEWSYQRMLVTANQVAHVLTEDLGLVSGNRVLLRAPNNPMLVACWFGVLKAGCIAVTTMPMMRSRDLVPVIDKAEVGVALCDDSLTDELFVAKNNTSTLKHIVSFNGANQICEWQSLEEMMESKPKTFENVDTASDDVALIAFTSGTTGRPKGVLHCHKDVLSMAVCFSERVLQPNADDVFIGSPPLAFTFALGALVVFPLYVGATSVLLEKGSPPQLAEAVEQTGATICFTSPTGYRGMLNEIDKYDLDSLKKCVSAGEHLSLPTFSDWEAATGIRLIDGIGSTEMIHIFISASGDDIKPGATGKAIPGYKACVLGLDDKPLPPGESGRLAVKGPTGCRYLADDRQGNYVINGWNVTGDIYRIDEDGYFWFEGRSDDMIVSSGYNISGPEVEDALLDHPAVNECAVVAVPDSERGSIPKAFVVAESGFKTTKGLIKELQQFVKAQIAPYKYPRAIEFIDALPKTETGKVQRFKLREYSEANSSPIVDAG